MHCSRSEVEAGAAVAASSGDIQYSRDRDEGDYCNYWRVNAMRKKEGQKQRDERFCC